MEQINITSNIILVEKTGILKTLSIKKCDINDLYKKCGFKTKNSFNKQIEWCVKIDKMTYMIYVYAKTEGKSNCENKYDFPPPIDNTLFYGTCAIIAKIKNETNNWVYENLTLHLWNKIYEKLFGGFEDLSSSAIEDELEDDELAHISKKYKTKVGGYLKDGFVVDSESESIVNSTSDEISNYDLSTSDTSSETDDNFGFNNMETSSESIAITQSDDELIEETYE